MNLLFLATVPTPTPRPHGVTAEPRWWYDGNNCHNTPHAGDAVTGKEFIYNIIK